MCYSFSRNNRKLQLKDHKSVALLGKLKCKFLWFNRASYDLNKKSKKLVMFYKSCNLNRNLSIKSLQQARLYFLGNFKSNSSDRSTWRADPNSRKYRLFQCPRMFYSCSHIYCTGSSLNPSHSHRDSLSGRYCCRSKEDRQLRKWGIYSYYQYKKGKWKSNYHKRS